MSQFTSFSRVNSEYVVGEMPGHPGKHAIDNFNY